MSTDNKLGTVLSNRFATLDRLAEHHRMDTTRLSDLSRSNARTQLSSSLTLIASGFAAYMLARPLGGFAALVFCESACVLVKATIRKGDVDRKLGRASAVEDQWGILTERARAFAGRIDDAGWDIPSLDEVNERLRELGIMSQMIITGGDVDEARFLEATFEPFSHRWW